MNMECKKKPPDRIVPKKPSQHKSTPSNRGKEFRNNILSQQEPTLSNRDKACRNKIISSQKPTSFNRDQECRNSLVSQQKPTLSNRDQKFRNNLASKYIDHMPYVNDSNIRLSAWCDIKEVLFPSCSDPNCDIVLNALKVVSRYPWEGSKMQPCTPKQQMIFLRNFRLVPSGTLLVDLQFVKDNINDLWEMVWLKHGTSLDACSRRCHYATTQLMRPADNDQTFFDKKKQNNTQECKTSLNGSDVKVEESYTETSKFLDNECSTQGDTTNTDVHQINNVNMKQSLYQLDNDCLTDNRTQQTSTEAKSKMDKSFPEYQYPTIETLKLIPRRVDTSNSISINTKHVGYTVIPVVKSCDKDTDDLSFCSGAEVSATFPQLHDYLDRLSSEFVAGHTDSAKNKIRRSTNIEGRCFTNWKIRRHGWNVSWQHMTSKDIVVAWNSVVNELQRLAGKAVDGNDILPVPNSGPINYKENFSHLVCDRNFSNWMSTSNCRKQVYPPNRENHVHNITLAKQKPDQSINPMTLYELCQGQVKRNGERKYVIPGEKPNGMERKSFPNVNRRVQERRNADLIISMKVRDSSEAVTTVKEVMPVNQITCVTENGNKFDSVCKKPGVIGPHAEQRFDRLQIYIGKYKQNAHNRLPGGTDTSTQTGKYIATNVGNVDKTTHPKKRQRVKCPTEALTLDAIKSVDVSLNKNQNALDSSDKDGPTLAQLLSHQTPIQRLPTTSCLSYINDEHSSINQNALHRNKDDVPQLSNVYIGRVSELSQQPAQRSRLFQYPTSLSMDPFDRTKCQTENSTNDQTFHHLRKCESFPKKTFEKYSGIWNRIADASNEQLAGRLQNTSSHPTNTSKGTTASTSMLKSKPQWNIDQIIKDHPRQIKGDSLYGISINKTQAHYASQLRNTSNKSGAKTQQSKPHSGCFQRQSTNEVLPSVVKAKGLMLSTPSGKPTDTKKYHQKKKEIWYRNESISKPKCNIHANNLLEMVSANPFNQTIESMIALRRFNCDFDAVNGSLPNATIGPRMSPLPKIDPGKVSTSQRVRSGKLDNSLHHQDNLICDHPISMTSESEKTESSSSTKSQISKKGTRTSFFIQNEEKYFPAKPKTVRSVKEDGMENKRIHSKHQKTIAVEKSALQEEKTVTEIGTRNHSDELPKLSKSENCLKSKDFYKENTSVFKSASSPGLLSNKYKVEVNDLTLRFIRLKGKEDMEKEMPCQNQKQATEKVQAKSVQCGKESQTESKTIDSEETCIPGVINTTKAAKIGFQNQETVPVEDERKNVYNDHPVGRNSSEKTKSCCQSNRCHCQMINVDDMNAMKSNINIEARMDNGVGNSSRPVQYLHNKKRWLIEYSQNTGSTIDEINEKNPSTQLSEVDTMLGSFSDKHPESTESESDFQNVNVLPSGSSEDGNEILSENEEKMILSCIPPLDEESHTYIVLDNLDDAWCISRDTTHSEVTDISIPTISDEILLVDENELGLVEEVVDHVDQVSVTDVLKPKDHTQSTIDEKNEKHHQNQNGVNMKKTIETSVKASSVGSDTETPFEGSVYVFDDSKKNGSRKGSKSGVNIIRRSVRQHLSPRKSMAEVSEKSIYSGSERTASKNAKKTKGNKSAKTKSASKLKTQTSREDSAKNSAENKGQSSVCRSYFDAESFPRSKVISDTAVTDADKCLEDFDTNLDTVFMDKNKVSPDTLADTNTAVKSTGRIKDDTIEKIEDIASSSISCTERKCSGHTRISVKCPNKVKQKNITQHDMNTANKTIQHLAAEQRRMLDIIKQSSSSRSLPSPAAYPPRTTTNQTDSLTIGSSSFSFVPVYMKDQACKGGYAHMEGVTCPYVIMDGYKFVAFQDVLQMFPKCDKACKVIRNVLTQHRSLSRTFCDWDQVYLLDQLFIQKGRSVTTGDTLIRVDSLVKHLPSIRDSIREEHFKLHRKGRTNLQCVRQY